MLISKSSSESVFAGSCFVDRDFRSAFALRICSRKAAEDFEAFGAGLLDPVWVIIGRALLGVLDGPAALVGSVKSSAMLGLFPPILPEIVLLPLIGSLGVRFALSVCGDALLTDLIMDAFVGDRARGTALVVGRLIAAPAMVEERRVEVSFEGLEGRIGAPWMLLAKGPRPVARDDAGRDEGAIGLSGVKKLDRLRLPGVGGT